VRRLFPFLLFFGASFLGLGWGLSSLSRLFGREREDALAALAAQRGALEQYAAAALQHALRWRMEQRSKAFELAERDPLAPSAGLYATHEGVQRLPRLAVLPSGAVSEENPSAPLEGVTPDEVERAMHKLGLLKPSEGPTRERERLAGEVTQALEAGSPKKAQEAFHRLLLHRTLYVLPVYRDVTLMLSVLEAMTSKAALEPAIAEGVLRSGLEVSPGAFLPGLQRWLLVKRGQMGPLFRIARIRERTDVVCDAAEVPHEDFDARLAELTDKPLPLPLEVPAALLVEGRWYLEPQPEGGVRGIRVEIAELLDAVATEMRERGLLEPGGQLQLLAGTEVQPAPFLRVSVEMPRWEETRARIAERYRLKSLLLLTCGGLMAGVVGLVGLSQRRKQRFLELKSEFIATVSHELRTPLSSIRLLGETLAKRVASNPDAKDYPERIVREADGLSFLVENVLSFNRIGRGRWQLVRAQVSLDELFSNLKALETPSGGPPLQLTLETQGLVLDGDPTLLQLLFSNLLRNARVYNTRSPVQVEVRVTDVEEPTIQVRDNGVGIPPKEWERVFEEFYRLQTVGLEVHGSGLGLALCRRIMKLHGGSLRVVTSNPDGTTFELRFPGRRA
jgi:signal transduction histidine kinase